MRVLVRPASSSLLLPQPQPQAIPTEPTSSPRNGVVVVGFVGRRPDDVAYLLNKIIDSNVFGSGNLDRRLPFEGDSINPEVEKWFGSRRLSFYHEKGQGICYVQFSSTSCILTGEGLSENSFDSDSLLDEHEFGDLQGLLFMFSVCHVIILIQEGSRFDTQMLKKFRLLQSAKQAMAPLIRSQNKLPLSSRPRSLPPQMTSFGSSPNNPPTKSRGILNRNASTITLMSGPGSYASLLPGLCTPTVLFIFLDDYSDTQNSGIEESMETSLPNFSSNLINSARPALPVKGSGSVVVLARPPNKFEGGLRKKLQSSLEAQIRFSIKKCRTLTSSEVSLAGSKSGGISSSAPLFSLDASKAVALVDACAVQSGESVEFAISLVEEVLEGKATSDSLLLEDHQRYANREDILSVKEFMNKQCDILRGKGGLVSSTNSGSSAGVGMAAVAAAAAAASAASGKKFNTPELPTLEVWLSSCQQILHGILSARHLSLYENEISRTHLHNTSSLSVANVAGPSDSLELALSRLESVTALNVRFSSSWCQKAIPAAKEVYLDGLPPCYPSSQHEDHLKKALRSFTLMVKGPAVPWYMNKLKDECTSIWISGRQLCDAVSLSGKPCMHQRHNAESLSDDQRMPHSSGFVYLHACACGRSRKLQPDPFDFETANVVYSLFADCDKFLPIAQFPQQSIIGPIQPSSWNLIRIGSSSYYEPSKGLLQPGFSETHKFLLRWSIFLENLTEGNHRLLNDLQKVSLDDHIKVENVTEAETKINTFKASQLQFYADELQNGVGRQMSFSADVLGNEVGSMGVGRIPSNFTMKKPFSEVVSGSVAPKSGFPPLFSRKVSLSDVDKASEKHHIKHREPAQNEEEIVCSEDSLNVRGSCFADAKLKFKRTDSDVQKHGNSCPNNGRNSGQMNRSVSIDSSHVYVGFEHECPGGHRFILTPDHLKETSSSEENTRLAMEKSDPKHDSSKLSEIVTHGKNRRQSNIIIGGGIGKIKNLEKSKEQLTDRNINVSKVLQPTRSKMEQVNGMHVSDSWKAFDALHQSVSQDDGNCEFLINQSLPLYMNCPYCKDSVTKNDPSSVTFASKISQLQRIFVVTPSFPILLAANPVIQFAVSCLPSSIPDLEKKLQFSLGCPVMLPPDSFVSLRLPFVYGVELDDGRVHSLKPSENQPYLTAWVMGGTAVQVLSKIDNQDLGTVT